jgi:hypothetical protein
MPTTEKIELEAVTYIGSSMNPVLKSGDRLVIIPYGDRQIRRGDVVICNSPDDGSKVIHRVISTDSGEIETRGDNSTGADSWVLSPDQIVGRVACARRGQQRRRIWGGPMGRLVAATIRTLGLIDSILSSSLRPVYHQLAKRGHLRKLLPAHLRARVILLNRYSGRELQLLMGRRVIGRRLPEHKGWYIRRPFRLFVDEASLPKNDSRSSGASWL